MFQTINKTPRALIISMVALVFTALTIAYFYYNNLNNSVDPRIRNARKMYEKYNEFVQLNQYDSIFQLMDKLEIIYSSIDHYRDSYEVGVLYNNRAAAWLSIFLQPDKFYVEDSIALLKNAESSVKKSIHLYTNWLNKYGDADEARIRRLIKENFTRGLEAYDVRRIYKFLGRRIEEMNEAREENKRRLSVSYTNLGTIKRHQEKLDSAAIFYKKAIDLWDQNLTAENNLNILLNKPLKKRNLIQKLFPPEK